MPPRRLRHEYTPRGSCLRLWREKGPEVVLCGPAGTGKSRACLEKLHAQALKWTGMRGLIVRKTAYSLTTTALVTWQTHVIPESLKARHVTYYGGSKTEAPQFQYVNGARIMLGGMDKATRIMSSEYDVIFVQEATELTLNDWESLTTRLRHGKMPYQQLIADCNPDVPTHWLKLRGDAGTTLLLDTRHEDNPVYYNDDGLITPEGAAYIARLDALTGMRKPRLRYGQWVAAEGMIYEQEWDSTTHLVDRFRIPDEWTRWWSVDFGYNHPFVCQWWAEDPDGRLFRYREVYMTRRTVAEHAQTILRAVTGPGGEWLEPKPRQIICDPAGAEERAQLQKHLGLGTTAARKDVTTGIQAVQSRLAAGSLFLLRDSLVERDPARVEAVKPTCTEEEIPGYVWDLGGGKQAKEQPLKVDDDGCDALRYMVATRDLQARPRVR